MIAATGFPALASDPSSDSTLQTRQAELVQRAYDWGTVPVIVRLKVEQLPEDVVPVILAEAERSGIRSRYLAPNEISDVPGLPLPPRLEGKEIVSMTEYRAALVDTQSRVIGRVLQHIPRTHSEEADWLAHAEAHLPGLKVFGVTPIIGLYADPTQLQLLLDDPDVLEVIEDIPLEPTMSNSLPRIGADASRTFAGYTGQGMAVAVLDTGVNRAHPAFADRVILEGCFSSNATNISSFCPGGVTRAVGPDVANDCTETVRGCGHGTHVAGTAAGNDGAGGNHSSVARDANLIAIQVFSRFATDEQCGGAGRGPCTRAYMTDVTAGLEWVYALAVGDTSHPLVSETHLTALGSRAIVSANMSLGGGAFANVCPGSFAQIAVDLLRSANVAPISSSGNAGYTAAIGSPACISGVISVGSTFTQDDTVSSFSNNADILDLLAPGQVISSTLSTGGYGLKQGTSMAAPHVAGAWAVLREAVPAATVDEILQALIETGQPITDTRSGADNRVKPRIQVDAALAHLLGDHGELGRPTLLAPTGTIEDRQPDYRWTVVAGADAYDLIVTDSVGEAINEISLAAATYCTAEHCTYAASVRLEPGEVTWQVRARNSSGTTGEWGVGHFSVVQAEPPPPTLPPGQPVLLEPTQNEIIFRR